MLNLRPVPTSRDRFVHGTLRLPAILSGGVLLASLLLASLLLASLLLASLLGVVGPAGAQSSDVGIRPGMSFSAARGVLLQNHYRPIASGSRDPSRCSAGRQDVCEAYPETISCSGTGTAPCRFIFLSPKAGALTIVADGRNAGALRISAVRHSAAKDAEWQRRAP